MIFQCSLWVKKSVYFETHNEIYGFSAFFLFFSSFKFSVFFLELYTESKFQFYFYADNYYLRFTFWFNWLLGFFFFAWVYCGQNGLFAWFVDNTIFIVQELKWKLEIFWTDERICQPPDRCSKNWTSFYIRARVLPDVNATQFNSNLWTSISNVAQSLNQREVFIIRKYFVESSNLMIHSDW